MIMLLILMSNRWFFIAVFSILYQAPCALASASLETSIKTSIETSITLKMVSSDDNQHNMEPVLWQSDNLCEKSLHLSRK